MKRIAVLFALTICGLSFTNMESASAAESAWRQALDEGNRRMQIRSYEEAQSCFKQAVIASKKDPGASIDDKVLCLESLANVLQIEDITQESVPKYRKSLSMLKKAHGKLNVKLLPTLEALAQIYYLDGQYPQALKYDTKALAVIHENGLSDSFDFARVARSMGQTLAQTHVISQTEVWYDQALTAAMDMHQVPDDTFLEGLLSDYIDVVAKANNSKRILSSSLQKELLKDSIESYSRTRSVDTSQWNKTVTSSVVDPATGKLSLATKSDSNGASSSSSQFDRVLDAQQKIITPEAAVKIEQSVKSAPSPGSAPSIAGKDLTLARINKQREEFYKRMIATDLDSLGANHPSTARDLTGLAYIYISEKRSAEAKPLLERALHIYKNAYGVDPLMIKRAESMLAAIDSNPDLFLENNRDVNEILATLRPTPIDAQKMDVALRLNYLGLLYYSSGNLEQAAKIYAWALPATANACGDRSAMTASCLYDYARLMRSLNKLETAQKYETVSASITNSNAARQAALSMP